MFLDEMLANHRMFMFLYTLMKVTARVSYIIRITKITLKFIYNILAVNACLYGGGEPQIGEVTYGGSPHLSGLPHLSGVPRLHVNRPLEEAVSAEHHR